MQIPFLKVTFEIMFLKIWKQVFQDQTRDMFEDSTPEQADGLKCFNSFKDKFSIHI